MSKSPIFSKKAWRSKTHKNQIVIQCLSFWPIIDIIITSRVVFFWASNSSSVLRNFTLNFDFRQKLDFSKNLSQRNFGFRFFCHFERGFLSLSIILKVWCKHIFFALQFGVAIYRQLRVISWIVWENELVLCRCCFTVVVLFSVCWLFRVFYNLWL